MRNDIYYNLYCLFHPPLINTSPFVSQCPSLHLPILRLRKVLYTPLLHLQSHLRMKCPNPSVLSPQHPYAVSPQHNWYPLSHYSWAHLLSDLSSPTAPLTRPSSFPPPPTGHDLMSFFPSAAPSLGDIDIVREGSTRQEVRLVGGRYVNTSSWFGREEREYFRNGGGGPSLRALDMEADCEKNRPVKRRRSIEEKRILLQPSLSPLHYSSHLPPQSTYPSHNPSHPPHNSPPLRSRPSTADSKSTPATFIPGTRRRAGKYTKRVFVQSSSGQPPSSPSPSPSSSSSELSPPPSSYHTTSRTYMRDDSQGLTSPISQSTPLMARGR